MIIWFLLGFILGYHWDNDDDDEDGGAGGYPGGPAPA